MRDCPGCGDPMGNVGIAQDETGRMFDQFRCSWCDIEEEAPVRPPAGWRQFWRDRVRQVRGAA